MSQSKNITAVLIGLILLAALVTWLWSHPVTVADTSVSTPVTARGPAARASDEASAATIPAASPTSGTRSIPCRDQSLDITVGRASPATQCVTRTRVIQNGNVRTYAADAQDSHGASLTIDAAGETILRAELTYTTLGKFSCLRDKCTGISVGPHDAQGARSLRLNKAKLVADAEGADIANALVSGTLRTIPDDQLSSAQCAGQLLLISVGDGIVHFCPDAGSGFSLEDDGSKSYQFMNGDGQSVGVALNTRGEVQSVQYGKFSCRARGCSGVSVSAPQADESRNFSFQGTTLTEGEIATSTVVLSGNVRIAAQ